MASQLSSGLQERGGSAAAFPDLKSPRRHTHTYPDKGSCTPTKRTPDVCCYHS